MFANVTRSASLGSMRFGDQRLKEGDRGTPVWLIGAHEHHTRFGDKTSERPPHQANDFNNRCSIH